MRHGDVNKNKVPMQFGDWEILFVCALSRFEPHIHIDINVISQRCLLVAVSQTPLFSLLPYVNTMPRTRDMPPQPVTLYTNVAKPMLQLLNSNPPFFLCLNTSFVFTNYQPIQRNAS